MLKVVEDPLGFLASVLVSAHVLGPGAVRYSHPLSCA
jgi:hypothetical protein